MLTSSKTNLGIQNTSRTWSRAPPGATNTYFANRSRPNDGIAFGNRSQRGFPTSTGFPAQMDTNHPSADALGMRDDHGKSPRLIFSLPRLIFAFRPQKCLFDVDFSQIPKRRRSAPKLDSPHPGLASLSLLAQLTD